MNNEIHMITDTYKEIGEILDRLRTLIVRNSDVLITYK
jgi:hypothetical protein